MKNILLLTDFSEAAESASEAALYLSEKLHTDLLLFNSYMVYPAIDDDGVGQRYMDQFKERLERSKLCLNRLTEALESISNYTMQPGDRHPAINSESGDVDLGYSLDAISSRKNLELIVMGSHHDGFFAENHVNSVLKHARCPVLVMPPDSDFRVINNVLFATDFDLSGIEAISYLLKLSKHIHFGVEVVHVDDTSKKGSCANEGDLFENHLQKLHSLKIGYHNIKGKDVIGRLNRAAKEDKAGMLALLHHHYPFFTRLFTHSDTKKAVGTQHLPLLIFPAKG